MYDGPTTSTVVVPELIEGKPVVSVGDAFKYSEIRGLLFPSSLKSISAASFYQCSFLANLVIPAGVRSIEGSAFAGCSSLQGIQFLSEALESLGGAAFSDCVQLRSVRIPTNVASLNGSLFSGCSSLTNVTIKGNLTNPVSVGPYVFQNCSALKNLVFQGEVKSLDTYILNVGYVGAFAGSGLTNVIFKKSVSSIEEQTFLNSKQLQTIIFEGDVVSVGSRAFLGCDELTDVYFLGQLTRLRSNAFYAAKKMRTLVLPNGLVEIEERAFENCTNLKEVIFLGNVPPQNGPAIFRGCPPDLKVKFPSGAAGWANFPNYGNRSTEPAVTVSTISSFPQASPIQLGQTLASSRLTNGTANVSGVFQFENTNTVPPGEFPTSQSFSVRVFGTWMS